MKKERPKIGGGKAGEDRGSEEQKEASVVEQESNSCSVNTPRDC